MVGFNLPKENLRCLVVLSDQIAEAISRNAGDAFWRGFIVEDRETGDSWMHLHLTPEQRKRPVKEQIQYIASSFEKVMRGGLALMAGTAKGLEGAMRDDNGVPKGLVTCFYPPTPEDPQATLDWLLAQDLIEVRQIIKDGKEIPIGKEGKA